MITQQGYTKDFVQKEENLKERKIPISRDQAVMESAEAEPAAEAVRLAQKQLAKPYGSPQGLVLTLCLQCQGWKPL